MGPSNPYQSPQTDVTAPPVAGVDLTSPFSPKGRFGRLSYIAWYTTLTFASYAIMLVVMMLFVGVGISDASPDAAAALGRIGGLLYFAFVIALVVVGIIFFIRRLHDIDLSGWWTLLVLVPIVNIVFGFYALLKAGTPGGNRFGPPRETRPWEQIVGIIGVVLIVLSLVVLVLMLVVLAMSPELMQQWS